MPNTQPVDPNRAAMDRWLEANGLLNYQTAGLSQAEIAQRYAGANVNVSQNWFDQTYGGRPQGPNNWPGYSVEPNLPQNYYRPLGAPAAPQQSGIQPQQNKSFSQASLQLGYEPAWGQDPKNIAEAYKVLKATPAGAPLPEWMQGKESQIEQAYNWFNFRNGNVPDTEWKWLPGDDPGLQMLSGLQGPPDPNQQPVFSAPDQVKQGAALWTDVDPEQRKAILSDPSFDIAQYPTHIRDQILNDPNFDWTRVPKWQKTYWEIMSNPVDIGRPFGIKTGLEINVMASPMALAGGRAGAIFGLPGKVAGAAVGYGLGVIGGQQYDPTGGVFDQPTMVAGAMAVLNKLAEGAEQTGGYTAQVADAAIAGLQGNEQAAQAAQNMLFDADYRKSTWEASRLTYEVSDFLGARNWIPGLAKLLGDEKAVLAGGGEDFIIGRADPVARNKVTGVNPVTGESYELTDSMGILQQARKTIHKAIVDGEDPREVVRYLLQEESQYVGAQVADFAGQMVIDPLELLPQVVNATSFKLAKITGNETAARAFAETNAPFEAARRYKSLVQSGDVAQGFDYAQMGSVSRWIAGVNEKGQISAGPLTQTGLLDAPTKQAGIWSKLKEDWIALTPEARAREGASMFYNNIGALLSTFDDPMEIGNFFRRLGGSDMKLWSEMGNKIANSPEWYTILPALKDFDTNKLDGLVSAWELAAPKREGLLKIADVLGEEPGKFIEDLAKRGTAEQDYQRVMQRLQQSNSPQAKQILEAAQRGEFTPDHLRDIVDAFSGAGALYWHPDQFKAATMDALGAHFDEWTVNRLQLGSDPTAKSAFFRTAALLKSAQSVLLLGGSPGYALTNGLSNMVHRAATGIYGYMTSNQIDTWLDRFGVKPARLEEGVGIGGVVETAATRGSVQTTAIDKSLRGNDGLSKAQRLVSSIGKGMPFNRLSSWFESLEGKNGYMIAMRDMWSKTWRRGVGFQEMTPELRAQVERAGINPNTVYSLIEAGMNKAEIERHILDRQSGVLARSLIHEAAQQAGMTSSQAGAMLEKIGVLDELDRSLANANTPDKIRNAFKQAVVKAADYKDMQTARDLKAMAENVTNKVEAEGVVAALDVVQQVNGNYFDTWLDHYARFGEMFEDLREIPDIDTRNKAIELNYKISDGEFRRINARTAANYQGVFDAWGKSQNPAAMQILASIAKQDAAMKYAYDFMRKVRREYFDTYGRSEPGDLAAQAAWFDGQAKIDAEFQLAFDKKASAEKAMGEAMGNLYDEMYGPAAGEAARKWWEDYTKFSAEIVKRERKFRSSLAGMTREQREAAKAKYYGQDKVAQIAELEKINQEGIRRLEKVIKRGGGQGGVSTPLRPDQPPPQPGAGGAGDEINTLIADAEQRKATEQAQAAERVAAVWDVAEEFPRKGLPFDRSILQDRFHLIGSLKKEAYGGIPDLQGLSDPRLTPERVQQILTRRAEVKAGEQIQVEQAAFASADKAASTVRVPKINDNTNLLKAISEHGGIRLDMARDLTGEKRPRTALGVFTRRGTGVDDMARLLADDGYPIDLNDPNDLGGIQQLTQLLDRARRGDKIYPLGHDHDAMVNRTQFEAAELAYIEAMQPEPFDVQRWQADLDDAMERGDLVTLYDRIGELPEEMSDQSAPTGETWNDYLSRIADETAARVEQEARELEIAEHMVRADDAMAEMEARGEAAMTRQIFREKIQEAFGLSDEQTNAYMELSDTLAQWYAGKTGESADLFYARYYEDVRADSLQAEDALFQKLDRQQVEQYARALVREGDEGNVRRAVKYEDTPADRRLLLNEIHKLNPDLAKSVALQVMDTLYQSDGTITPDDVMRQVTTPNAAKGSVTFGPDGMRATIKAFEAGDFSTLIHENAHVFRRMLRDVADRTNNVQVKADLQTIEQWAGAKDGQWTVEAEEKFARGFERYITEGKAPNARLRRAFDGFKRWMLDVYRSITGTAIDIQMTDQVRAVFDRLIAEEEARTVEIQQRLTQGGDQRNPAYQQLRDNWETLDETQRNQAMDWILQKTMTDPLSGLETLVAKEISQKPAGWVDATSDLNALKAINDTWGHEAGDAAIAALGKVVKVEVEKVGGRAFRVGGDEMSYWFPDNDAARRALDAIDEKYQKEVINVGGEDRSGFSMSYGWGESFEAADAMLYKDKIRRAELGQRAERGEVPASIQPARPPETLYQDFGKPQQKGLFETGEDMPLFSGTPQRAQAETFQPQAQQAQPTLFDMRPQMGDQVSKVAKKKVEMKRQQQKPAQPSIFDFKQPETLPDPPAIDTKPGKPLPTKGLVDFGEKLGGARKDKVSQFAERTITDADINRMTLSEIWPKAELDAIEDVNMAAMSTALREAIPSKPRDSYKLRRWVEKVKLVKDLARMANERGFDSVLETMRTNVALRPFADQVDLMRSVPREHWKRIEDVHNYPEAYIYKDGVKTPKPYATAKMDGKRIEAVDMDGLVKQVMDRLETKPEQAVTMKFEIRYNSKTGERFINKVGDPLYRKLKTFDNAEDARAFVRNNYDDLVKAWDDVKAKDNIKETDVRRATNEERAGADHRQGQDATPEMFLESFGFRGVEFGNWVSQGSNLKERQGMLNASYDALMDLADVVGVPPKALSLNGALGLGLGSRGSGSASAHFEPDAVVINLTKTKGAGTLAHEWFHALDNYFSRQRGGEKPIGIGGQDAYRTGNFITYKPEPMMVTKESRKYPMTEAELLRRHKANPSSPFYDPKKWIPDPNHPQGVRPQVERQFALLVEALDKSPMSDRAALIDKGQSGYWSRIIERAARSFENYVIHKMQQKGYSNDYLANVATVQEFSSLGRDAGRYPYLLDEELIPVAKAFDDLFGTIQTRETPKGVELYQMAEPPADPNAVFTNANKPFGTMDEASGFKADSEWSDQGYRQHVRPLLDAMQNVAVNRLNTERPMDGAFRDVSPEGQKMLQQYIRQVQNDMGAVKLSTMKWGESQRDFAQLNYNRRYGFDKYLDVIAPYQFFYTRSLATWGMRGLDKPAWFAKYARIRNQQNKHERDIPERLRNKFKIDAPWLPDWMGDALYIDPLSNLFTPASFLRPFETMMKDKNMQVIETERILQEWAADGQATQDQILQAAQTQEGSLWERARAEAGMRRESQISDPFDFFATMFGPAWYLSTPLNLMGVEAPFLSKGDPNKVSTLPLTNTARAVETVTQGTWAEPIGKLIGLVGKPEMWMRDKLNLPEFGEYGDYYIDRQLANMVADGLVTSQEAQIAMIERQGPLFEQAQQRVKMELAMRVPLMGTLYATTHEGIGAGAQAFLPSLFGAGLLPAGELEYRGLKTEWNAAWKEYDAGNKQAINDFFADHPEYEAYLSKGKEPEERLRSYLVGEIWDRYMELGPTNQKTIRAQMGDQFAQSFLDKETRSYETLTVEQLTQWAQMLGGMLPRTEQTAPVLDTPQYMQPQLNLYDPRVTAVTDKYFTDRKDKFPEYYALQQGYYSLPSSQRTAYLAKFPKLKEYFDWRNSYYDAYPELKPIFNGQAFKTVDTSAWPPFLEEYVVDYAMTGRRLPKGAYSSLEQVWLMEGMPMGDFQTWLDSQVVPAMMYQTGP